MPSPARNSITSRRNVKQAGREGARQQCARTAVATAPGRSPKAGHCGCWKGYAERHGPDACKADGCPACMANTCGFRKRQKCRSVPEPRLRVCIRSGMLMNGDGILLNRRARRLMMPAVSRMRRHFPTSKQQVNHGCILHIFIGPPFAPGSTSPPAFAAADRIASVAVHGCGARPA